ncbi:hypothetical protein LTS18_013614, partial [Coniosporium uncinatum]
MIDASEDDVESDEGEPDEEEMREKKRKARKAAARKPAAKKPKANGEVNLAIRPAANAKAKRPRKARPQKRVGRVGVDAEEVGGLYRDVFAGNKSMDDVAGQWLQRFGEHESLALSEIFNFVLQAAGCNYRIDEHVVEDPDHFAEKLTDIQDEYQAQNISEYPLIAKGRAATTFKHNLEGFFHSLIRTLAASAHLYDEPVLMENVVAWIGTMSSAGNRPFRHTATVASLAIVSALCETGKALLDSTAVKVRQTEGEKRKKGVNKKRVSDLDDKVKKANEQKDTIEGYITNWFDTVFVHRYRDIDPRIRTDCVQALSDWIETYPDVFFESEYLRYLGWILSDTNAPTRLEVVKQLQGLFSDKTKIGGLKSFTEKFRARMVEMATRDAEASVRAAAVELLDILRESGLLEPDDIDS